MSTEVIEVRPKKRGFVRRHKVAVGAVGLGALFVLLPQRHRALLAWVLLAVVLASAGVFASVLIAGVATPADPGPRTSPTSAGTPPARYSAPYGEWCLAAKFCS